MGALPMSTMDLDRHRSPTNTDLDIATNSVVGVVMVWQLSLHVAALRTLPNPCMDGTISPPFRNHNFHVRPTLELYINELSV